MIIPSIMILASLQILSITEGAILGSILLLVLKSISMEDVYEAINWPVIFLIALLIPIGTAMENTGAANFLSNYIIYIVNGWDFSIQQQIIYVISILYFITFITSAFISNAAVAIILCPLAVLLSNHFQILDLSVDPTRAFLMAICFGASASFMTPIGYQTNLMVFAPGQYKFKDFMIAGFPITIIFWIVASFCIPAFWPFIK
jgi:di/tricarboxylate transporter